MNRTDALAEARRRWGDGAWVLGPRRTEPRYKVGFGGDHEEYQRTGGRGASWREAFEDADALSAQAGMTLVYRLGREARVVVLVYGNGHPTFAEKVRALAMAAEHGVGLIEWRYQIGEQRPVAVYLQLCAACGNPARGDECSVCRAISDVLLDERTGPGRPGQTPDDYQARLEAADRYVDRAAAVRAELGRQIKDQVWVQHEPTTTRPAP